MLIAKCAASCQWATQTLWLDAPQWLEAWSKPWACVRDPRARLLETTDECRACARWQVRARASERPEVQRKA
jgi:hypothetical protein